MKTPSYLILAIGISGLITSTVAIGGARFDFECIKDGKHYQSTINFGGGFSFGEISGYCPSTNKIVRTVWQTAYRIGDQPPKGPAPISIFDPNSGKILTAYLVDGCPTPIVPIESESQLRRIPECVGSEFIKSNEIEYD